MGSIVSSGSDNDDLVDNLMSINYIRSRIVERVFRGLDRGDYITAEERDHAYSDCAWRNGPIHLSPPCLYSVVMEGLELRPGISFLNIGSGTGYLSTLAGLIIGSGGISHGIEVDPMVVDYATKKLDQFIENSPTLDEFDFCEPKFFCGNGLCLAPLQAAYDRVYCGAQCPDEYHNYMKQLIKVGGVLVMPLNGNLIQMRRKSETEWSSWFLHRVLLPPLRIPTKEESGNLIKLDELTPPRLQALARGVLRSRMRKSLQCRHPELRESPPRQQAASPSRPERCMSIENDSDHQELNIFLDLDETIGSNNINGLSMGGDHFAGALHSDFFIHDHDYAADYDDGCGSGGSDGNGSYSDSDSDSSSDYDDYVESDDAAGDDDGSGSGADGSGGSDGSGGGGGGGVGAPTHRPTSAPRPDTSDLPVCLPDTCRGVLTLEFQDAPQPIINVSRQRPDIVMNTSDNTTVVTAEFPKANTSARTDNANAKTKTDNTKTENSSTSSADSTIADRDSTDTANEASAPDNDTPKTKGRKSKITLKKPRTDTKITKNETDGAKTETRDGNKPNELKRKMSAEVEIYLAGKDVVGTSYRTEMDWEDTVEIEIKRSGEESTETSKELNMQKIDCGIGENSPTTTSGSTPDKTQANEDSGMDGPSDSVIDNVDAYVEGRSSAEAEAGPSGDVTAAPPRSVPGSVVPRVRLSIRMKCCTKKLPLPYTLKKYVNYGRRFQF